MVCIWAVATIIRPENYYNLGILDGICWNGIRMIKLITYHYMEKRVARGAVEKKKNKSRNLFCLCLLWYAAKEVLPWHLQQLFPGYAGGVLHGGLCGMPVLLQTTSNLSDLVLSDQLSCQKICKSFSAASHWLKAIPLLVEKKKKKKSCKLSSPGALKEQAPLLSIWNLRQGGGKFHQPRWKVELLSEFAVNHIFNTVYLKQFMCYTV